MTNRISIFLICFTASASFNMLAGTSKAFEITHKEGIIEIEAKTLESFKGAGMLPKKNLLEKQNNPLSSIKKYLGVETEKQGEFLVFKNRPEKIYGYLKSLSAEIDIAKTEPGLEIENNTVINFTPPRDGITLDIFSSAMNILEALEKSKTGANLAVETDAPVKSLMETNSLGINELIATGESSFQGSPKNRIHNIKVGVNKMKGVIIKPKEEFSFNKYLGPVEEGYGFLPELVIKRTGTVPELGGGLCQVSSTTFRAAMKAGLPITQRKNHAYAVQYYSPQGTDATIYPGIVDLKFINDTPGHILIWPYIKDASKLVFEFYGTPDGRKIVLEKPLQYDRKTDGSMKAEWTRIVEKDGKTSTSTFKSVYLSPALFHKTEAYPTTTPQSGVQMPIAN